MRITFELEDLGRPAIFFLPAKKLTERVRDRILQFLRTEYGGDSHVEPKIRSEIKGEWTDAHGAVHADENWEFEVSFLGKERIPILCQFLAEIAHELGEACVYIKLGEETRLIRVVTREEKA